MTSPTKSGSVRPDSAVYVGVDSENWRPESSSQPQQTQPSASLPETRRSKPWDRSANWRSRSSAPPSFSRNQTSSASTSSTVSPRLCQRPEPGTIVLLPRFAEELPSNSVLYKQWSDSQNDKAKMDKFGKPWDHPSLVLDVDSEGIATIIQVTSINVVAGSTRKSSSPNLTWARRYMPIRHNEQADHPDKSMPILQLRDRQMLKPSSVNLETALRCEWQNLRVFVENAPRRLTEKSLKQVRHHRACFEAHPKSAVCAGSTCLQAPVDSAGWVAPIVSPTTTSSPRVPTRAPRPSSFNSVYLGPHSGSGWRRLDPTSSPFRPAGPSTSDRAVIPPSRIGATTEYGAHSSSSRPSEPITPPPPSERRTVQKDFLTSLKTFL